MAKLPEHKKKQAGRPTVRTPENRKKVLNILKIGGTRKEAAATAQMSDRALQSWITEDEIFSMDVASAASYANIAAKNVVIQKITKGSVNEAKWWLERKAPEEFSLAPNVQIDQRQQSINIEGGDDGFTNRLAGFLRGNDKGRNTD